MHWNNAILKLSWFAAGLTLFASVPGCGNRRADSRAYLAAAEKAARWLESTKIETDSGAVWAADPSRPSGTSVATDLYSGSAGVVLFFLQLHRATGEARYLETARAGADYLAATLADTLPPGGAGLYTGLAGWGFVFCEVYKATGDTRYRRAAMRCVTILQAQARRIGSGVEWAPVTDIISGNAGIGLFLLYAAEVLDAPAAQALAVRAGQRLIAYAQPAKAGLSWPMAPSFPRRMPNFSHGTAGVSYFLAALYERTQDQFFLYMAQKGALYLQSITATGANAGLIFHHEPGGESLFYLGWCHGPPGTARLFYKLYQLTGQEKWLHRVYGAAETVRTSGIPEQLQPGFWNNAGQCCGSAGIGDFFLALHKISHQKKYLNFAVRLADNLLTRATPAADGLQWVQAEHRVQPDLLQAQTGYMQGAAGIGMFFLNLYGQLSGKETRLAFPDAPY